jgi:alkylhydroperoxidase family enzyme
MSCVYASARDQGLTDEMIEALPLFEESELFSTPEKIAIRFADVLAGDHTQASSALFDQMKEHYTQPQIMALGWRAAIFIGYGRLVYATGLQTIGGVCPLNH